MFLYNIQNMSFGLANSAKKSRYLGQTVNQNQGGGDKKAGFPYMVGRSHWTSIALGSTDPVHGHCATLKCLSKTLVFTSPSRPVGSWTEGNSYWRVQGT
jgi:hypothetical protein